MTDTAPRHVRAIVLAAGQGTRMKSSLPKVLHEVCGEPMVTRILSAATTAGVTGAVVVVGYGRDQVISVVRDRLDDQLELAFAVQEEQRGTADAMRSALPALASFDGGLLMLNGDVPNLSAATLERLVELGDGLENGLSFVSARVDDPTGYGRVVRDAEGEVTAIVEHDDCTPEQLEIAEVNAGLYYASAAFVRAHLGSIDAGNAQSEFYLTDLIAIASARDGARAWVVADAREVAGVNDRTQLAEAEAWATRHS